ncbi:energy transducer TonB [Thermodesulfobacteriota bacterium]
MNRVKTIANIPLSLLVALLVTTLLFIGLPLLTQFQTGMEKRDRVQAVLISQRKPPPPPEPERDEKIEQKKKQEPKKAKKAQRVARPKVDLQLPSFSGGIGGISISGLINKDDFAMSDSLFVSAFKLNEVDQEPKVLRSMLPRYPFEARQKGVEGRVTLRFVVDKNGKAQEAQVVAGEPEGVFDESALAAVAKYKFRPAYKNGEPVDCIVNLPISFTLNQ